MTHATPAIAHAAYRKQRARVKKLGKLRAVDASASWRRVLLGKLRQRQGRLLSAMSDAGLPEHIVERTASCGKHVFIFRNLDTGQLRLRHYTCHNRFCLMCQRTYLRQVRETALSLVPPPERRLSFLTLTQPAAAGVAITKAIDDIVGRFRQIRRSPLWKRRVTGGIYVVEITRGSKRWWHVHLHVIIDSGFWPLEILTDLCNNNPAQALHCHIKAVDGSRRKAMNSYLAKYMSKPFDDDLYDHPDALTAFIRATRGRRLLQAFGTWQPRNFTRKASRLLRSHADPTQWRYLGELHEIIDRAEGGSLGAARLLAELGYGAVHTRPGAISEIDRFWQIRAPPPAKPLQLWEATA